MSPLCRTLGLILDQIPASFSREDGGGEGYGRGRPPSRAYRHSLAPSRVENADLLRVSEILGEFAGILGASEDLQPPETWRARTVWGTSGRGVGTDVLEDVPFQICAVYVVGGSHRCRSPCGARLAVGLAPTFWRAFRFPSAASDASNVGISPFLTRNVVVQGIQKPRFSPKFSEIRGFLDAIQQAF